jgi:nitroreductase
MDLLLSHRSIRKYSSKDVSDENLKQILDCGIRASNTGNMQLYSVIVTRNRSIKELLSPLHFNQKMVIEAPIVLTVCIDVNRFYKWCKIYNTETDFSNLLWLLNGTIDASLIAQNICVAAENFGLGICYLGTTLYNSPEISEVLDLPSGVVPVTAITIGYPEILPELVDRLPLEAVIHDEKYQDYSDEDICKFYSEKENLESSVNFVKDNLKDNLAQVYTEVRYKSADSVLFSKKLLEFLEKQGFNFK